MRKLIITAAMAVAACSGNNYDDIGDMQPAPAPDSYVTTPPTARSDWMSDITPMANSNVRGTAKARTVGNVTRVMIDINGAKPNAQHQWRITKGACGDNGAMVGNAKDYPMLTSDASGKATGRSQLAVALSETESYSVTVLSSPTDAGSVLACGRLAR